jgi:hypothetical protein
MRQIMHCFIRVCLQLQMRVLDAYYTQYDFLTEAAHDNDWNFQRQPLHIPQEIPQRNVGGKYFILALRKLFFKARFLSQLCAFGLPQAIGIYSCPVGYRILI